MRRELTREEVQRTKRCSVAEGSAASVMMGCGEQYVVPFALRLGASNAEIAFLSSGPFFLGSLFQLLGARLTEKLQERKKLVLIFVLLQSLSFAPLFLLPLFTRSVWALTCIFSLYLVFGNIAGPPWSSWIGDVIPAGERGTYFGKRNRVTLLFLLSSIIASGFILTFVPDVWVAFGILFLLALTGRFVSFLLFTRHYEPPFLPDVYNHSGFREFIAELPKTAFGSFALFRSVLAFAVMVSAPFFAIIMLTHLRFSYLQYSIVVLIPVLIKALTMTYWGSLTSVFGNKNLLKVSSVIVSLIPLYWVVIASSLSGIAAFLVLAAAETISGFAWAGLELTTFNYMLEASSKRTRTKLFANYAVTFGFAVMVGGLTGSGLSLLLQGRTSALWTLLIILAISSCLRVLSTAVLLPRVRDIGNHEKVEEGRLFYEVLVHRPLGFSMRPMLPRLAFLDRNGDANGKRQDWFRGSWLLRK